MFIGMQVGAVCCAPRQDMAMLDPYLERMLAAKQIAQKILVLCESYEQTPSPMTINRFLTSAERLADLAESIDTEQTVKALGD